MSVSKSVPSVIYFFTDFSLRIGIYMYKFQFFVGILRSLTAKSDKFREIKETSISGFLLFSMSWPHLPGAFRMSAIAVQ